MSQSAFPDALSTFGLHSILVRNRGGEYFDKVGKKIPTDYLLQVTLCLASSSSFIIRYT